jgi:hypothetical protein
LSPESRTVCEDRFSNELKHDDDWRKHRIAFLCRADVGVTLCKPKTMGEYLSGKRAASLETARPEDGLKTLLWSVFTVRLPEGFRPQAKGVPQA